MLFCCNLGVRLLGLQPGRANPQNLTLYFQSNVVSTSRRRRGRRKRPPARCLRHKVWKRLRRRVLPLFAWLIWQHAREILLDQLRCYEQRFRRAMQHAWSLVSPPRSQRDHFQSDSRLPVPVLSYARVRCAPCPLLLEESGFLAFSQQAMVAKVLHCLHAWCSCLNIPADRVEAWKFALQSAKPDIAVRLPEAHVVDTMLTVAACVACLLESKATTWEHVQSFSVILQALCLWIFPPFLRTKRSTSLTTDFLFLACGSLKLALITDWQSRGGYRKRKRASRRCLGLPPPVFQAFLDPLGWTAMAPRQA